MTLQITRVSYLLIHVTALVRLSRYHLKSAKAMKTALDTTT